MSAPAVTPAQNLLAGQPDPDLQTSNPPVTQTIAQQPAQPVNVPPQSNTAASQAPAPTRGDMWRGILMGALTGLAHGAQGGAGGAGFLGGVGAGGTAAVQQAQQQKEQAQQQAAQKQQMDEQQQSASDRHALSNAQVQLSQQALIKATNDAKQSGMDLAQHQADQINGLNQWLGGASGVQKIGTGTMTDLLKQIGPEDAAKGFSRGQIWAVPNPDGTLTAYRVSPDWKHQVNSEPLTLTQQTGVDPKTGEPITQSYTIPAGAITNQDYMALVGSVTAKGIQSQTSLANTNKTVAGRSADAKTRANATVEAAQVRGAKGSNGDALSLGNLTPQEYQSVIDGIGQGTMDASSMLRYGKGDQLKILADVKAKYPNFDMAQYKTRLGTQESFSYGKDATQIQSFNALIGHIGDLNRGVDAIRNSGSPLINMPINWLKANAGNPATSQILSEIQPVRTEFLNFLNNNHALSEQDKTDGRKLLNENLSPAQFQAVAKQFMGTAAIRLRALNDKYRTTMGKNAPGIMSSQSAQALTAAGYGNVVQELTGKGGPPQQQTQAFSLSAWQKANPGGNIQAAQQAAQQAGYKVVQ